LEHANYIGIDGEALGTLGNMRHIVRGGIPYMRTLGSHPGIGSIGVITCWKAHHPGFESTSQVGNPRKDFLRCSLEFNGWWIAKTFPIQLGEGIGINYREGLKNMEGDLVRFL
jgi:hypothetical protein